MTIHGETGTVLMDREGYEVYDQKNKMVDSYVVPGTKGSTSDLLSRDAMTDLHFGNFIAGIRKGEKLNSPITIANVSVTVLQLSNIAWEVQRELRLDTANGPHHRGCRSDEGLGTRIRQGVGGKGLAVNPSLSMITSGCDQDSDRRAGYPPSPPSEL